MRGEGFLIGPVQDAAKAMPQYGQGRRRHDKTAFCRAIMFRTSISKLLISIQGVILVSLLAATSIIAIDGYRDFQVASKIEDATQTDSILFDTILAIRGQSSRFTKML